MSGGYILEQHGDDKHLEADLQPFLLAQCLQGLTPLVTLGLVFFHTTSFSLSIIFPCEKPKRGVKGGEKTKVPAKFCSLNSPEHFLSIRLDLFCP